MNALIEMNNQSITFFPGQCLPFFVADGQEFMGATLQDIQSGAALIKTATGQVEAIAPESMKLLNEPNAGTGTAPMALLRDSLGITFPLSGPGSAIVTNIEGASDQLDDGSGGRVYLPPPLVINLVGDNDVYIRRDSDGNLSVTICEK